MGKSWRNNAKNNNWRKAKQQKQAKKHGSKPVFQEESFPYDRQPTTEYGYVG